jgi:Protein of unknown function (DUF2586)
MNNVTFQVQQGGLGRVDERDDNVSCLWFPSIAAPNGWGVVNGVTNVKSFRSIEDVGASGIGATTAIYKVLHYHAKEFFRLAPGALLYIAIGGATRDDIFAASVGAVKQIGVVFQDLASVAACQAHANWFESQKAPVVFIYGLDGSNNYPPSSLPNAANFNSPNVSIIASGSGSGEGEQIVSDLGLDYLTAVGTVLGLVAKALVHESIAHVEQFNVSDTQENEVIQLSDGSVGATITTLDILNSKRYLTFRKFVGRSGTYLNDNHTASVLAGNDYAYMNDVRVMNKVKRELYKVYLPLLNSSLSVDAQTGQLAPTTIDRFELVGNAPLLGMQNDNEISGFDVYVNPNQNILATSAIEVKVRIVVNGIARNIVLNLGYTSRLS